MDQNKSENVIGALTLALSDAMVQAAQSAAPGNISAAGLTLIGHAPGITIDALSRGLGLSHPGAVRLVDRMTAQDLVKRRRSDHDGRAVTLFLTDAGRSVEAAILSARRDVLRAAMSCLGDADRDTFTRLSTTILTALVDDPDHAMSICRLCDGPACAHCPVEAELMARSAG